MKGGTTPLHAVYEYAKPIDKHGFVFMDSPAYDRVACTGQIASGANLICFTTGRGSMFGSKPAPTIKLASYTPCSSVWKTTWTSTVASSLMENSCTTNGATNI